MRLEYIKIGKKKHIKTNLPWAMCLRNNIPSEIERNKKELLYYYERSINRLSKNEYDATANQSSINYIAQKSTAMRKAYEEGQNFDEYIAYMREQMISSGDIIMLDGDCSNRLTQIEQFLKEYYPNITELYRWSSISESEWNNICENFINKVSVVLSNETLLEISREVYSEQISLDKIFTGYIKTNKDCYRFHDSYDYDRETKSIHLNERGIYND